MIRICAWCDKVIEIADGDNIVTHGICKSCIEYFTLTPRSLQDLIEEIDKPILIINSEGRAQGANRAAVIAVDKNLEEIKNKLGGEIIECIHSKTPEGCGKTIHCTGCAIRKSVMETLQTGKSMKGIVAYQQTQDKDKKIKTTMFKISTEKVGDSVLLQIDESK